MICLDNIVAANPNATRFDDKKLPGTALYVDGCSEVLVVLTPYEDIKKALLE